MDASPSDRIFKGSRAKPRQLLAENDSQPLSSQQVEECDEKAEFLSGISLQPPSDVPEADSLPLNASDLLSPRSLPAREKLKTLSEKLQASEDAYRRNHSVPDLTILSNGNLSSKVLAQSAQAMRLNDSSSIIDGNPNEEEIINHLNNAKKTGNLLLRSCGMVVLPEEVFAWPHLQCLNIDGNAISLLPPSIGRLLRLNELSCCWNKIRALPDSLGQLRCLQSLDLRCNLLQVLPDSLGALSSLERLLVADNQLVELPETVGNLQRLVELDIQRNHIHSLPVTVRQCAQLEVLSCFGNSELVEPPQEVCNQGVTAVMAYLQERPLRGLISAVSSPMSVSFARTRDASASGPFNNYSPTPFESATVLHDVVGAADIDAAHLLVEQVRMGQAVSQESLLELGKATLRCVIGKGVEIRVRDEEEAEEQRRIQEKRQEEERMERIRQEERAKLRKAQEERDEERRRLEESMKQAMDSAMSKILVEDEERRALSRSLLGSTAPKQAATHVDTTPTRYQARLKALSDWGKESSLFWDDIEEKMGGHEPSQQSRRDFVDTLSQKLHLLEKQMNIGSEHSAGDGGERSVNRHFSSSYGERPSPSRLARRQGRASMEPIRNRLRSIMRGDI